MTSANSIARIYDALSGRNRIINGSCMVAQRGSVAVGNNVGDVYGGPDRFYATNTGSGGAFTQSQGTLVYNGITKYAVTQTMTTAVTSLTGSNYLHGIVQLIEGLHVYDLVNQPISISFIFNTNLSGTYSVCLRDAASPTVNSYVTSFVAVANTPTLYTFQIPAFATTIPTNNLLGLTVAIGFLNTGVYVTPSPNSWASGNYLAVPTATNWGGAIGNFIQLTDLQLEAGEYCTPFERKSYNQEYQDCQRYYQVYSAQLTVQSTNTNFGGGTIMLFGPPMRAVPTVAAAITTPEGITGTLAIQVFQSNCFQIWCGQGFTVGQWCVFQMTAQAEF